MIPSLLMSGGQGDFGQLISSKSGNSRNGMEWCFLRSLGSWADFAHAQKHGFSAEQIFLIKSHLEAIIALPLRTPGRYLYNHCAHGPRACASRIFGGAMCVRITKRQPHLNCFHTGPFSVMKRQRTFELLVINEAETATMRT